MLKNAPKAIAINSVTDSRLLDHIAPISYLMKMPLLILEEKNLELVKKYYPMVEVQFIPNVELSYEKLARDYDLFFQCTFWEENPIAFFAELMHKKVRFVYCPHGNSDKGHISPLLEKISNQDIVWIYGEHMIDRLKKQNLYDKISYKILSGNYRLSFYEQHKKFYDEIVQKEIFSQLKPNLPTILYAPTWNDREKNSSFYTFGKRIAASLPPHFNLILKTHPLLEEHDPGLYYQTISAFENKPNVILLDEFPLIYPLLQRTDILISDFSSVGYDFLAYQRPMFFCSHSSSMYPSHPSLFLHRCGIEIPKDSANIFSFIEKNLVERERFSKLQEEMFTFAFGKQKSFSQIREEMYALFHSEEA